jgi:TolB-like protein
MNEPTTTAEAPTGRHRGARAQSPRQAVAPQRAKSPDARSVRVGEDNTDRSPRGYRVDYPKLKTLCRQAGLKMIDLYEPGVVPRQLISEGTLKKWRRGGRGTSESLVKIAEALSDRLRWGLDWRELIQAGIANVSLNRRLAILPFHAATGDRVGGDGAGGFRASILAQLSKLPGLRVISFPTLELVTAPQSDDAELVVDVVLSATLRAHGDLARLDVELTDIRTREVLWASSYPFSEADQLRAQTAIAGEVANQIGRTLAS